MPTAEIDGLRVEYIETGSGLPIVFVPGLAGSKEWFHYQLSGLSDRYRVISYDLRRARGKYDLDILASDLSRLLGALRLPAAVVAGHSFGALVAIQFAVSYPSRCLALIAMSAAPCYPAMSAEQLVSGLCPGEIKFESFFARLWKRLTGAKPAPHDDSDPLAYLVRHNAGLDSATLDARLRILREVDLSPALGEVSAPTLIIAASGDLPKILSGSQLMYQSIAGSTLEVIEDAGHFCFYTRHDLVNSTIDDYLNARLARL